MEKINLPTRTIIVSTIMFLVIAFVYIFFIKPKEIEKHIQAFCDSLSLNSLQEEVVKKAKESGFIVKSFPPGTVNSGDPLTTIQVSDGVSFNRYYCSVHTTNEKVTDKKVTHLD